MEQRFKALSKITLLFVMLVILAGSVVRMSGSGMGCPDWPKCFGQWIPPTDVSQIPENYKEIYSEIRAKKTLEFCRLLEAFGMHKSAELIRNDPSLFVEGDFNPAKTWTEYVNRLIGFVAGNLMLLLVIFSLFIYKKRKILFFLSLLNLVLISITAWFGAIVVATNLLPWILTVHMILALLIVVIQVLIIVKAENRKQFNWPLKIRYLFLLSLLFTIVQIFMGTQVRQQIDNINEIFSGSAREAWVDKLDVVFYVHRSFSLLILALNLWLFSQWRKGVFISPGMRIIITIIGIEIISGIVLSYLGMPALLQPVHLVLSTLLLATQFHSWFASTSE